MSPDDPRHGSIRGVSAHQRDGEEPCLRCKAAKARYEKRRRYDADTNRRRIMPALGARRRIQALHALGWSQSQIAHAGGWKSPQALQYVMRSDSIYKTSWERINDVYERLSMQIPPFSSGSVRARNRAARLGYAPPLAWDDIDTDPEPRGARLRPSVRHADDLIAEYEHLIRLGVSHHHAISQLGVTISAIEMAYRRSRKEAA